MVEVRALRVVSGASGVDWACEDILFEYLLLFLVFAVVSSMFEMARGLYKLPTCHWPYIKPNK